MSENFRNNLINLRTKKNITQEELAMKIGVTRQAISKWERGEGLPDLYNISELAKALDVTVDELLNGSSQEETEEDIHKHTHNEYSNQFQETAAPVGNYLKKLLYKAKHTSNTAEAKKIRKGLILVGALGIVLGFIMVIGGFIGFAGGAMNAVGSSGMFNPLPFMLLFISGGAVSGISVYILIGGLSIAVVGVTSKYLDTRDKCPNCGDEIDKDEKVCSSCGYELKKIGLCVCGKKNSPDDIYCRECGRKLKNL
jgi:transcriptional regulator with XRE-family HTH domain/ribosomal protein L37E